MAGPFEDTSDKSVKSKVELKTQGKSMFDEKPKQHSKEDAQQKAAVVNERQVSYNTRAMEITSAFMKLVEDTTIAQNKSVFSQDIEKEVIGKFQQLILDIEDDEQQPPGMGAVGAVSFLMRVILLQREKINQLSYQNHLIEKKMKEIAALIPLPKLT